LGREVFLLEAFRDTCLSLIALRNAFLGTSNEGASLAAWILRDFLASQLVEAESNFH